MKNIYKIIIGLVILTPTVVFGAILQTSVNQGNGFINPLRITDRIEAQYYIASSTATKSTFPFASTTAISATAICISTDCKTAWPTGGGGSGGGTWSTTTSSVSGRLINYPNNTTDIPAIGGTSTTTAKYWFDPNTQTSYLTGNVGIGTTSPVVSLDILSTTGSALSVTGGIAGTTIAQFSRRAGAVADIIMNGSGGDPQIVFSVTNNALFSTGVDNTQYKISGSGVLGTNDVFVASTNGNIGLGTSSPYARLSVVGEAVATNFTATSSNATSTLTNATISNRLFIATTTDTLWASRHPVLNAHGAVAIAGNLTVGSQPPTYADDNLSIADFTSNVDNYSFLGIQNISRGPNASADLVFGNALTTASDYYFDCGIAGSNNNTTVYPGLGPAHWGYCFTSDAGLSMGIATTTTGADFRWVTGQDSLLNTDIKMVLTNAGNLGVGTTSPRWKAQFAATTSPQLVLTSNGTTESHWGFRNAGGNLYLASINPITFATSTTPSLSFSPTLSQVSVGTSTFAGGVDFRNATVQQKSTYIINISTTSPSWATSTKIFPTTTLQTWNSITCFTDTGTLNVAITNNGNPVNTVSATSSVSTFALTQNNRFNPGSKVNFSVGTPVSTPSQIGCAIDYISNI